MLDRKRICSTLTAALVCASSFVPLSLAADITKFRDKPDDWYTSAEGRRVLDNVLSWQRPTGGWWKTYDVEKPREPDAKWTPDQRSIFDNGATWSEMRLLARGHRLTGDARYADAFMKALAMTMSAQYANGGFPQEFPLPAKVDAYPRHITFNDDAMVSVLRLLRDVASGTGDFAFVPVVDHEKCKAAFERGIECILNCQIIVAGEPTVWCAQHDSTTLAPAKARAYELPSLSGGESASIAMLLMSIENPNDRVKRSIHGAAAWYERAKIVGVREQRLDAKESPRGYDVIHVADSAAPALWARFYDLETGKPFYCGRDGVKKETIAEIEIERRSGYAWLRPWGTKVLEQYAKWKENNG